MRILVCALGCLLCLGAAPKVTVLRCPNDGIQPQAAVDAQGRLHLVYLKGPDAASDVFYVRSDDSAATWSPPIRVNSHEGSAMAVGTVRGAHLALGRGREWVHVAWMGSAKAQPRAPKDSSPMLYARLKAGERAFEPQRNLITAHPGLDGGGSVAADESGKVLVAWHAPGTDSQKKGEEGRVLYVTKSADDGKTFAAETETMPSPTGVCGCCGMRVALGPGGDVVALYRAANSRTRDLYLVSGGRSTLLSEWAVKTCPMSTATFARSPAGLVAAWESEQQVWMKRLGDAQPVSPPGGENNRKHPSVAAAGDGHVLLAWAEGTGWKRGGSVAWQLFSPEGLKSISDGRGVQKGLAVWSLPTAVWAGDRFIVLY
jgi:hypothetical protein